MNNISYLQINIFFIILLSFLLFEFYKKKTDRFLPDQKVFEWMLFVNIAILVFDSATWLLNGQSFPGAYVLNMVSTACFYMINPLLAFFYLIYCEIKMKTPEKTFKKILPFYAIPFFIHFILVIASFRYGLIFRLDEQNYYHRGSLLIVSFILSYVLIAYAFAKILLKILKSKDDVQAKQMYRSLLLFPIPPLIGGVLQFLLPDFSVIWCSTVFSLLIIFINIQNLQITTDPLTNVFNRRQLIPYLTWKTKKSSDLILCLIMIDLDNFKSINDQFGHIAGDSVLVKTAQILLEVCKKSDFIVRYGGDEFILVIERKTQKEIDQFILSLYEAARLYNEKQNEPYMLSFSSGYSIWKESYSNFDAFIADADEKMYQNKKSKILKL